MHMLQCLFLSEAKCNFSIVASHVPQVSSVHKQMPEPTTDLRVHGSVFLKLLTLRLVKVAPNVLRMTRKYAKVLQ